MAGDQDLRTQWFRAKLASEKQKNDVVKRVKEGQGDFVLLDTRPRMAFEKEHIAGAVSFPLEELEQRVGQLDRAQEYVTYCWSST